MLLYFNLVHKKAKEIDLKRQDTYQLNISITNHSQESISLKRVESKVIRQNNY